MTAYLSVSTSCIFVTEPMRHKCTNSLWQSVYHPVENPKLFHTVMMKKINEDKNAQGQTGDVSLLQDSVTRSEKSLHEETTD